MISDKAAVEEFWDVLEVAQDNIDPGSSDAWTHANDEINNESSFSPTSSDGNKNIEDVFDLFCHSRITEDLDEESSRGGVLLTQKAVNVMSIHLLPHCPQNSPKQAHLSPPNTHTQQPTHTKTTLNCQEASAQTNQSGWVWAKRGDFCLKG